MKFHGLLHYVDQIKKFGSPLNYFGGFLESFLKDKLKNLSKIINGHLHRMQHFDFDLLTSVLARLNQTAGTLVSESKCHADSVQVPIDSLAWFLELVLQE